MGGGVADVRRGRKYRLARARQEFFRFCGGEGGAPQHPVLARGVLASAGAIKEWRRRSGAFNGGRRPEAWVRGCPCPVAGRSLRHPCLRSLDADCAPASCLRWSATPATGHGQPLTAFWFATVVVRNRSPHTPCAVGGLEADGPCYSLGGWRACRAVARACGVWTVGHMRSMWTTGARSALTTAHAVSQMAWRKLRSQVSCRLASWRVRCCVRRIASARSMRPSMRSMASV